MYAVKQNPVLKLMGANFYRTEDMQTMCYLSQYRTKVFKLYYKSLVLNCARLIEITHSTIILLRVLRILQSENIFDLKYIDVLSMYIRISGYEAFLSQLRGQYTTD